MNVKLQRMQEETRMELRMQPVVAVVLVAMQIVVIYLQRWLRQ